MSQAWLKHNTLQSKRRLGSCISTAALLFLFCLGPLPLLLCMLLLGGFSSSATSAADFPNPTQTCTAAVTIGVKRYKRRQKLKLSHPIPGKSAWLSRNSSVCPPNRSLNPNRTRALAVQRLRTIGLPRFRTHCNDWCQKATKTEAFPSFSRMLQRP